MHKTALLANAFEQRTLDKRIDVLRRIAQTASISQAARDAGISYKAAWQAIDVLTNLTGVTLVDRKVGGAAGGGATVTEHGLKLLEMADALEKKRAELFEQFGSGSVPFSHLSIKTSMRNMIPCFVSSLDVRGQTVRVGLVSGNGQSALTSKITKTSMELLALEKGLRVLALFKAMSVSLKTGAVVEPGGNTLSGTVVRLCPGETGTEFTMEIGDGVQVVGFAPQDADLKEGDAISAIVDESAVVIALEP